MAGFLTLMRATLVGLNEAGFKSMTHSVYSLSICIVIILVVNEDAYHNCNKTNPKEALEYGNFVFKLKRSGLFFFISGHDNKCKNGEKLIIIVMAVSHHDHVVHSTNTAPTPAPVGVEMAPSLTFQEYIPTVRLSVPTTDVYIAKKLATIEDFALLHEDKIYSESKTRYLQHEHYALWEVIEFGDSYKAPPEETAKDKGQAGEVSSSTKKKGRTVVITAEDTQKRKNDVKAKTTLLLALLDEHQLRFSKYDSAKELWEAILKTFGGNEATKKTKKNQLKQQYSKFKAEGSETLEQTFNMLQAIVSHFEFKDVPIKQDDLNQKFLTSLAPEWLVYTIVWRNRDDLDTMSLDDVYNHLKWKSEVPTVQGASTASAQVPTVSIDVVAATLSYDTVCAFIATQTNGSQIKYEDVSQIDDDDIEEMDIKWNLALLSMRADRSLKSQDRGKRESYKKDPKVEEPAPKAMIAIDADEEEVPTKYALMAKSSSNSDNEVGNAVEVFFQICGMRVCLSEYALMRMLSCLVEVKRVDVIMDVCLELSNDYKCLCAEPYGYVTGTFSWHGKLIWDLSFIEESVEREVGSTGRRESGESGGWEEELPFKKKLDKDMKGVGFNEYCVVPTPPVQVYSPPKKDMSWMSLPEFIDDTVTDYTRPTPSIDVSKSTRVNHAQDNMKLTSTYKSMTPRAVLLKSGTKPINRHFSTARPTLKSAQPKMTSFVKTTNSNVKRPFERKSTAKNKVWSPTVRPKILTVGLKVPTAKPSVAADKGNKEKAVKASARWIWKSKQTYPGQGSNFNGVSVTFKKYQYIDTQGRLKSNLVKGLPFKSFKNDHSCVACLKGKQHKASCKSKLVNSVSKPLHTLHMDLFGPTSISSLNHKWYCLVVTDDFSRFSWTFFLKSKDETSRILRNFITEIENLKDLKVKIIRSDNGGEFRNKEMDEFCSKKGIKREFSNARTPPHNGLAERRNRTRIEAARTMLADAKLPVTFWAEAVNTSCYVQNRVLVTKPHNKTPYELFNERSTAIGFLRPFRCHVMIPNTLDHLGKFDAKGDEGYFVGYSLSSKAFTVFNKRTKKIEEDLHVDFLENKSIEKGTETDWLFDIDTLTNSMNCVPVVVAGTSYTNISGTKKDVHQAVKEKESPLRFIALPNCQNSNPTASSKVSTNDSFELASSSTVETKVHTVSLPVPPDSLYVPPVTSSILRIISRGGSSFLEPLSLGNAMSFKNRIHKDHPKSQIIGPVDTHVQTRQKTKDVDEQSFIAIIHQKTNPDLLQYCLFSCFLSEKEPKKIVDAFKDPSWVEAMQQKLLRFKIQNVWVLVDCPNPEFPHRVYKVEKAMYELHQAPKAWYGTLSKYLLDNGFQRGIIDQTLFVRKHKGEFLLVQVYVDDIIFGSSNPKLCREFKALMHEKFQMSAIGEFNFFLGLQVLQKKDGIFFSQEKYVCDILKKFRYTDIRAAKTHMDRENPWGKDETSKDVELHLYRSMIGSLMYLTASRPDIMFAVCACARHQVTPKECHLHVVKRIFRYIKGNPKLGLWYPKESPFDLVAYSDNDYGGANQDRKPTTRGCRFLGIRLISWQCKKQTIVATSTTEA
uniref:Uncharacterized mitochondrial protein AtMg00810-like n=1 Tax=Tanacetum cinerariifolium TaxID=118510 RepID=A0A6L2KSI5_TANCI|nr:uncharacterized mitochondrial protein AtMg00810-like [Tanacetum cinerariifolium]